MIFPAARTLTFSSFGSYAADVADVLRMIHCNHLISFHTQRTALLAARIVIIRNIRSGAIDLDQAMQPIGPSLPNEEPLNFVIIGPHMSAPSALVDDATCFLLIVHRFLC